MTMQFVIKWLLNFYFMIFYERMNKKYIKQKNLSMYSLRLCFFLLSRIELKIMRPTKRMRK